TCGKRRAISPVVSVLKLSTTTMSFAHRRRSRVRAMFASSLNVRMTGEVWSSTANCQFLMSLYPRLQRAAVYKTPDEARLGSSTGGILLKLDQQGVYRSADSDDGIAHLVRAASILCGAEWRGLSTTRRNLASAGPRSDTYEDMKHGVHV